jgi:hypothetical protein
MSWNATQECPRTDESFDPRRDAPGEQRAQADDAGRRRTERVVEDTGVGDPLADREPQERPGED